MAPFNVILLCQGFKNRWDGVVAVSIFSLTTRNNLTPSTKRSRIICCISGGTITSGHCTGDSSNDNMEGGDDFGRVAVTIDVETCGVGSRCSKACEISPKTKCGMVVMT